MKILPGGLWPVMLTPFNEDKSIDIDALEELVDFYISHGARGLFANCLSSEMYQLTFDQQLFLTNKVVAAVDNRVPVVASCTFMGESGMGDQVKQIHELGTAAVVLITSLFGEPTGKEDVFRSSLFKLLNETESIPLGLYECPVPFKRLVSTSLLKELASTGRFRYFKDTSCDATLISNRVEALKNTNLGLFNANTPAALDSLKSGAAGLSPISANFYPELYSELYELTTGQKNSTDAIKLQHKLSIMDAVTRINYPLSAKYFLTKRRLKIKQYSLIKSEALNYEEKEMLDSLFFIFKSLI